MRTLDSPRTAAAVSLVVLLLASSMVPAAALTAGGAGQSTPAAVSTPDSQYINVTSDVRMWERSPLPLRTDPSTADTVVDNQNVFVNVGEMNSGDVPANKRKLAIYGPDATVPIQFRSVTGAGTGAFAGEDVQLLVAKVDGGNSSSPSMMSENFSEAVDRPQELLKTNATSANGNVEYELVDAGTVDDDGTANVSYDLAADDRGAGHYVFFLVANGDDGDGVAVENGTGELSVTGDAEVLGFDTATAHRRSSDVEPTRGNVTPGENVTFDVSGGENDSELHHTVVLYNESTFADSRTNVNVNGSMDDGVSNDEVEIERSIDRVNGAVHGARWNGSAANASETMNASGATNASSMAGDAATDRNGSVGADRVGSTDFGRLVEIVESQSNSRVNVADADESENVTLDASLTRKSAAAPTNVSVETLENWSAGEYRWVHVAVDDDGSVVSSSTGTVGVGQTGANETGANESETSPIRVTNVSFDGNGSAVSTGEGVTFSMTVENTGSVTATQTIELAIDGETIGTREVELAPGESTTIEFTHTFEAAGTHDVAVTGSDGTELATGGERLTVESVDDGNAANVGESDDGVASGGIGGPGSLPFLAVIAFVVIVLAVGSIYLGRQSGR